MFHIQQQVTERWIYVASWSTHDQAIEHMDQLRSTNPHALYRIGTVVSTSIGDVFQIVTV